MYAPSLRPIQLRCIVRTRSGQPPSISRMSSSSCSAYRVMRKNHCSMSRFSTDAPQRQQTPPEDCSFESTVCSCGHQLTGETFL